MTTLIVILSGLFGFVALLLTGALFIKKKFAIGREVIINKPKRDVFNHIKYLKNQDKCSLLKRRQGKP